MPNAPVATSSEFPTSEQQRRAAGWRGVDARREQALGGARQHRPDVRPDASTRSTSWRCRTTAPTRARRRPSRRRRPAPRRSRRCSAPAPARRPNTRVDGRPRLQDRAGRGRTTCSSSRRSAIAIRCRSAASFVKGYNLPVVTNINLINPTGTLADGLPVFCTAGERRDPRRSALQRDQQRAVDRRVDLPEHDAAVHPPQLQRHRLRLGLHARQERKTTRRLPARCQCRAMPAASTRPTSSAISARTSSISVTPSSAASSRRRASSATAPSGAILNDNVFGVAIQLASGIPVNLRSNLELNNDGTASDRPHGVARNSLSLPARKNVDCALLAQVPHPGRHGGGDHRGGQEPLQHRSSCRA